MPKKVDPEAVAKLIDDMVNVAIEINYSSAADGHRALLARALDTKGLQTPGAGKFFHEIGGAVGLTRFLKKYGKEFEGRLTTARRGKTKETAPTSEADPALLDKVAAAIVEINFLGEDVEGESMRLAKYLDDAGLRTPRGNHFLGKNGETKNLRLFLKKYEAALADRVRKMRESKVEEPLPISPAEKPDPSKYVEDERIELIEPETALQLTPEEIMEIRMMLRQRREAEDFELTATGGRRKFQGKLIMTAFRLPEALKLDATKKCRSIPEERRRTGGTLSSLVNWLLWNYLGCDEKYVQKP